MTRKEHPYYFRDIRQFRAASVNAVFHETESVSFLCPKIW